MSKQRAAKDCLPTERRERLETVSGWAWDVLIDQWETGFRYLSEFVECEGHCLVPQRFQTSDGLRLGRWVSKLRAQRESLSAERKERLEALPGWVWDPLAELWETGFRYLKEFVDREGHCRIPTNYQASDGFRLGSWVSTQRVQRKILSAERKERLEAVPGWTWDAFAEQWETGFRYLKEFADREGHCQVPRNYLTSAGHRLGSWIHNQRNDGGLTPTRKEQLQALPGWTWDVLAEQWELGFCHLKEFASKEGHCRVPANYRTTDGYRLGQWVSAQRGAATNMPPTRKSQLESQPGWIWDILAEQWESGFCYLKEFVDQKGHCQVQQRYKTNDGFRLGAWVSNQRSLKDGLSIERKKRLEALSGWLWLVVSEQWELGFNHLMEFAAREGHCQIPGDYRTTNGYRLGQWVTVQRAKKKSLLPERIKLLESMPNWVWSVFAKQWEQGYSYLSEFAAREGHCKVPALFATADGYRLGLWVSNQRRDKDGMPAERKKRLEALPGWLWISNK
ncbi:MAG: helicase associated domain-containing protein [Nitrosomonas sp.]|nr:helicase associated domain-containing protein [Nitrosomonas sp.]MDP1949908.1 helicase associated domain-containing protein [Nitrosomonas sp.]